MIEEITIVNSTLNQSITLNKTSAAFLLADDSAIDWGTISADISTYDSVSRIGVGVNNISMATGRDISIVGWIVNDDNGTIEEKKSQLRTFCNPFDEITIVIGEYKIDGVFSQIVKYPSSNKENNEIICKFLIYIFCPNPLFSLVEKQEAVAYTVYKKSFVFPLVWQEEEPIVFGLRQGLGDFILTNSGTLDTGFEAYIYVADNITGLHITNLTNNSVLSIKSTVTLENGDIIYINTVFGKRSIKVGKSLDNLENAFSIFDLSSEFLQLLPGENQMQFSVDSGSVSALSAEFNVQPLFYALEGQ